jgi:hypothetical protein
MKLTDKLLKLMAFYMAVTCWSMVAAPKISTAQPATLEPAEKLATAEAVLARYAEVTGGAEKYREISGLAQTSTLSLAAAGIEGKMEMKYAGPKRLAVSVDMGPAGKERSGVYDDVGWSDSLVTGTRLVTGDELEQLKTQVDMRQYFDPAAVYKEMEIVGQEETAGQTCYVLKLTRTNGNVEQEYYSVGSGLKVKSKMTAETAMGAIPIEIFYHDYKDFSGYKQPTRMTQKLPNGMEMEIKVVSFVVNPEFEKDAFDLPESVKKLVDKQAK